MRPRERWILAGPYLAACAAVVVGYFVHVQFAGGEVIDLYGPLLWLFGLPWSNASFAIGDRGAAGLALVLLLLAPLPNAALLYAIGVWLERRRHHALPPNDR